MPPLSRGMTYQRIFSRNLASRTTKPTRPVTHPSRPPRDPSKKAGPSPVESKDGKASNTLSVLDRMLPRGSRARQYAFRFIILCPILGMGLLHMPFEIMWVNGASMSPFLNPNHESDIEVPSYHSDRMLVRIRSIPDILPDANAARKTRRKAESKEPTADETQFSKFERGQIVTFHAPHSPDKLAVKRIVGLPGDKVQPLAGYSGGDEPVIVPWNHVWVEGDAGSMQKSIDSNWYGPISQNLIVGGVKAVLTPWWWPRWIDWKQHTWPALERNRVEEAAVVEAASDPQVVTILQEWTDGTNQERLRAMKDSPEAFRAYFASSEDVRKRVRKFYRNAAMVLARDDPDSERFELAQDIIKEMENIYGRGALRQGMIKRSTKVDMSSLKPEDRKAAIDAEQSLRTQGWTVERDDQGKVVTR